METKKRRTHQGPKPDWDEIKRQYVRGLIVAKGLGAVRVWPTIDQLSRGHDMAFDTILRVATRTDRNGLNWLSYRDVFKERLRRSREEEAQRIRRLDIEGFRFRMKVFQVSQKIVDGATRAYLRSEPTAENRNHLLKALDQIRLIENELGVGTQDDLSEAELVRLPWTR